ncbi:MAG: 2-C-methyl-D-erythritol 4-phosphate cytidylyltransferase [Clostridiales bacterium]|nr:2-C-methyl-D-erythritol 4-phosphate cytidylyltransferase [Candidatus Cacconaster stercorequi]
MNILLLMMGGSGTRFGADRPKQYTMLDGKPIFAYILEAYQNLPDIDRTVIVTNGDWVDFVNEWVAKMPRREIISVTVGGASRSESVLNGLKAASAFASNDDNVLIHDATHPYVDVEGTRKIVEALKEYGGATLGACQYDTCYEMDENQVIRQVIPRQKLVSGASPEAFHFGDIYRIYTSSTKEELDAMTSAGAIALHNGITMKVIPANVLNLKITYPGDMELFTDLCHTYFFRK